jgi:hypothetical protein
MLPGATAGCLLLSSARALAHLNDKAGLAVFAHADQETGEVRRQIEQAAALPPVI